MRTIKKGNGHRTLNTRNLSPPTTPNEATKAWKNFRSVKKFTRDLCLVEQFYLCGYSEIALDNHIPILDAELNEISRELGIHLEHVQPKSLFPEKTFQHANIIACGIDNSVAKELRKNELFGGHAKQRWFKEHIFISPLNGLCSSYFHYDTSGRVVASEKLPNRREKAKARLTIYILNLNSPILVNWRKVWLGELERIISELDGDALMKFAEVELAPTNGKLRPFHSAQKQLFGRLGTQICLKNGL